MTSTLNPASSVAASYEWFDSNGNLVAVDPWFTPTNTGEYYLMVTDLNGCEFTSESLLFVVSLGVDEENISDLNLYPNPTKGMVSIVFSSNHSQKLQVRIVNIIGEEVFIENLEQFVGEYTKQIDLSNNAKGIYFLEVETIDGIINKKLILQ
jgi:hypothetical protein